MNTQRGLGRGLGALIPTGTSAYRELSLDAIEVNPLQPRQQFDADALDVLADSIKQIGVLQPIVVRETGSLDRYELIAGERRWRAARPAGLATIPAVIKTVDDESSLAHAVIGNIHRVNLNPLEEAAAYRQLIDDFEVTHDELGKRMGRSRAAITNTIRLLSLPVSVHRYLMDGELSAGHARALLGCTDDSTIESMATRVVTEGWSVRATEQAVRDLQPATSTGDDIVGDAGSTETGKKATTAPTSAEVVEVTSVLSELLSTDVDIKMGRRKPGGQILIRFADLDDLDRLHTAITAKVQAQVEG